MRADIKSTVDQLAIFGGRALFDSPVHVGRPNIGNRRTLLQRLGNALDSRWLTNDGPYVREFERSLREQIGVRHCVAMCNATLALEIAFRAAGLTGEVIMPSFTFVATAHAAQWVNLTPVFCDIDPRTHNIDPARVERLVTARTTAIVGVHLWGRACDEEALADIARRRGLVLILDAAHAVGCTYHGRPIGTGGAAQILSFHATKVMNTFEGGAIVTNDDGLAKRARLMRQFGFTDYDQVSVLGTNAKMTEASAIMGLASLERLPTFVESNRQRFEIYRRKLSELPGLTLLSHDERERTNYHYVVVEVDQEAAGLSRDELMTVLQAENVLARRYFYPGCHRMEPYRSTPAGDGGSLPATERIADRVLCLPTGTAVSLKAIREICEVVALTVAHGSEIRRRLRSRRPGPGAA